MKYKSSRIELGNRLAFWRHFDGEERFFMYNPFENEYIMGAKRHKALTASDEKVGYPYAFSSSTFFEGVKDEKWESFGNETIVYDYYLVEKDGEQMFYYLNGCPEIENAPIDRIKHSYISSVQDYEDWEKLFSASKEAIQDHVLEKVVISREIKLECDRPVHIESILLNLCDKNPNCFTFAYHKDGKTFLGATPEVLVQKQDVRLESFALAGTMLRSEDNDEFQKNQLLNDPKNRREHEIVIERIKSVFSTYTNDVEIGETGIMTLRNLHHLSTPIHAVVSDDSHKKSGGIFRSECAEYDHNNGELLTWVKRLHPTPAMGGYPVDEAMALIEQHESHERGLYASPIGVVKGNGDGLFVVGIRSALIQDNRIFACAGCGIVEKSTCMEEYQEITNKLRTITESL